MLTSVLINRFMNLADIETRKESERLYRAFVTAIAEALKAKETIILTGVGALSVTRRAPKQAKNPRTGSAMSIPERYTLRLRTYRNFRLRLTEALAAPKRTGSDKRRRQNNHT